MRIALVVLRSQDPLRLSAFYAKLGIAMIQERHGDGLVHFAGNLELGVIEVYPAKITTKTTYGLAVHSPETFRSAWQAAGGTLTAGGMALDPDGNAIYITAIC